jgi:predicted aspartyl protease
MEISTMGKVLVRARIENLRDLYDADRGTHPQERVRAIEVAEALVDTGATFLSLPKSIVQQLGLHKHRTRTARTPAGIVSFGIYEAVRLTVQGRDCLSEVVEVPDQCPVLIGQIPLEALDFIVDPVGQRLLGNPDHGGEQMIDMFLAMFPSLEMIP